MCPDCTAADKSQHCCLGGQMNIKIFDVLLLTDSPSSLFGSSSAHHSHKLVAEVFFFFSTQHTTFILEVLIWSEPVLMLVVPSVEIYVKRHNTARSHAGDQGPKTKQKGNSFGHKIYFKISLTAQQTILCNACCLELFQCTRIK